MRTTTNRHDVVVVGAGQAGLCASYFLTKNGIEHIVLERGRIAESWRSQRWDSFCMVTPNWTLQLPGKSYVGSDPTGFLLRSEFVAFLQDYYKSFEAPVQFSMQVQSISRDDLDGGYILKTANGALRASNVIVAAGMYQSIRRPKSASELPSNIEQLDVVTYKNPTALPDGGVLVVGTGQSGCQIAEEILHAGRNVFLCVGNAGRIPRTYRGRDLSEWQVDMGYLDHTVDQLADSSERFRGDPHVSGKKRRPYAKPAPVSA